MFPWRSSFVYTISALMSFQPVMMVESFRLYESEALDIDRPTEKNPIDNTEIMVPKFDLHHEKWFDADSAMERLRLSQTRVSALLRASMDPANTDSVEAQRIVDADNQKLRDDIERVHRIAGEISSENKHIQSLPIFRSSASSFDDLDAYSFLQIGDNSTTIEDWSYCACGSGPNGTMVFADRKWPDPQFMATVPPQSVNLTASPTSMLQIRINGRRLALKELPECNCSNPWDSFDNTANMCKLINSVTVCLIHVSTKSSAESSQEISTQAQALLDAIDKAVASPSFMEIWSPFRFQL